MQCGQSMIQIDMNRTRRRINNIIIFYILNSEGGRND